MPTHIQMHGVYISIYVTFMLHANWRKTRIIRPAKNRVNLSILNYGKCSVILSKGNNDVSQIDRVQIIMSLQ